MSALFYYWKSNGGCEACDALEGVHFVQPARPHPHCQCTIIEVSLNNNPMGFCLLGEPIIVCNANGSDTEVEWEDGSFYYSSLVAHFVWAIVCRDGTTMSGTLEVEPTLDDFSFSDEEDHEIWTGYIYDEAESEVQDIADSDCPACIEV